MQPERPHIFCIGFNKTATVSFNVLFKSSGITSAHWGGMDPNGNLALQMARNFYLARPLLQGLEEYTALSDMTYADDKVIVEGCRFFKELHQQYPDAYFILNTRETEGWIRSRINHRQGHFLERTQKACGLSEEEVLDAWRAMHVAHDQEVMQYFGANPGRFMRFEIEQGSVDEIARFLSPDFEIKTQAWGKKHNATTSTPVVADQT